MMDLTLPGGFGEENVSVVRGRFNLVRVDQGFLFILRRRTTMVGYNCSGVFSVCVRRFQIAWMPS
ncbi:uncharacterized protein LACBIDRAFT_313177 [Laccaria bicolor S238N-H82]|uniref:Predicted protein n=1 Tax=Laccaria bicolor (strain S238N-H82 / ATCC MYA-4686) TaxID=486041 RepID=B0DXQ2_LACBS|nr:uncharacterized protein LACBIDRAFT_313177 [Laccaria bicolor S238N-H82]EDR00654.1 predicted protein [Laccaria bicolor S238N-H82]|eukprot:XP_001888663.1 predicted protein [Laccaria bicolor S238N-H82]